MLQQRIYRRIIPRLLNVKPTYTLYDTMFIHYTLMMQSSLKKEASLEEYENIKRQPFFSMRIMNRPMIQTMLDGLSNTTDTSYTTHTIHHRWFMEQNNWDNVLKSNDTDNFYMIGRTWTLISNDTNSTINKKHLQMFHMINGISAKEKLSVRDKFINTINHNDWCPIDIDFSEHIVGYVGSVRLNGKEVLNRRIGWCSYEF